MRAAFGRPDDHLYRLPLHPLLPRLENLERNVVRLPGFSMLVARYSNSITFKIITCSHYSTSFTDIFLIFVT